jgi:hypothetical protein
MAETTSVRRPIFARIYERMAPAFEAKGAAEHRTELLAGLVGRVIEVGAGTGLNFKHCSRTVTVVKGTADDVASDDGAFDAGVVSLVLCSVPSEPRERLRSCSA